MNVRKSKSLKSCRGQSLLETALIMPLMLTLVLNTVNLGYFFFVIVNLTSATRSGAEYSMMGPNSASNINYPPATTPSSLSVATLMYRELTGAVWNAANTTVQICSPSVLVSGTGTTSGYANCAKCTSSACGSPTTTAGSSSTSDLDPESPTFVLNRVDVQYSFPPLIPGTPWNLILIGNLYNSGTGQYTFYRHIEMRAM
ncbi:MAG: pilus assembly protein [Acidobacteria bacterium]|nr:pilus assembly protein [Acidobacteriota bacterium]